ncbi:MAG: ATP synthase F1 subunit gamma [Leptospirales bacterium]|jgi:F-type H+-transporting ATPase subunit gamma
MAGSKIIKKRIASVKNTRKITRTMEMVATAKSKKLIDRVNEAKPYGDKLLNIMESLATQGGNIDSPYLRIEEQPRKAALVIVSANRGLCGGYNTNLLRLASSQVKKLKADGKTQVDIYMVGKKGAAYFKFLQIPVHETIIDIDDTFKYEQADELVTKLMDAFEDLKYDRVEVVSTVYYSAGSQRPEVIQLLPVGLGDGAATPGSAQTTPDTNSPTKTPDASGAALGPVIYEPDPATIASEMIPLAIKTTFYRVLLEAVASEQIARRIAMKNATDAAGEMVKQLTRTYNRARQAGITQEILEIVGGAEAV